MIVPQALGQLLGLAEENSPRSWVVSSKAMRLVELPRHFGDIGRPSLRSHPTQAASAFV
jgi:hypothetical protein